MAWLRNSRRILDICDEAVGLAKDERRAYLDRACANEPLLLEAVCGLLQAIEDSGSFLCVSEEEFEENKDDEILDTRDNLEESE